MGNKALNGKLYCYVEAENAKHAKTHGKLMFGSHSAYVNALIAKDRGVTPKLGTWKAEGESKKLRDEKKKEMIEHDPNQLAFPSIGSNEEVYE